MRLTWIPFPACGAGDDTRVVSPGERMDQDVT